MRAVERWNWNQVERAERQVDQDPVDEHQLQHRASSAETGCSTADEIQNQNKRHAKNCDDQIRRHAGERDDDVAFLEISVIPGIHGHWLRAAECNSGEEKCQRRKNDREKRIDVFRWIPRQPAELISRGVAVAQRSVTVRVLVRDHRE